MKVPQKIIIALEKEYVDKLDAVGYNEALDEKFKEAVESVIEKEYLKLKENSKGFTVKKLFETEIVNAKKFNDEHRNSIITDRDLDEIRDKGLKRIIKGLVVTCPIENDLVKTYRITTNEKVRKYTSASNNWRSVESYNIYISTNKGDFVYISAINTVKTLENYKDYQRKGLKYA